MKISSDIAVYVHVAIDHDITCEKCGGTMKRKPNEEMTPEGSFYRWACSDCGQFEYNKLQETPPWGSVVEIPVRGNSALLNQIGVMSAIKKWRAGVKLSEQTMPLPAETETTDPNKRET